MAPTKRQSNGRSPLVNPQRQITSFFTKTTSSSPSPSPSLSLSKLNPNKLNPNPKPSDERSSSPDPSPTTPSPLQSKPKKPRLVIGQTPSPPPSTPSAATKSYREEVVGKRIRVYWPLDKAWYEGCVKSFEKEDNKHLVQYEDGEEESLDLGNEKIEWVQESVSRFKRLRRGSSLAFKKVVIEDDEEMEDKRSDNENDSGDEDWEKNAQMEQISEGDEVDLVDEQEEKVSKGKKPKAAGGEKKNKNTGDAVKGGFKVSVLEPLKNVESEKLSNGFDKALSGDASERFSTCEAEKLCFLGQERRDANRRCPGDVNYVSRTLYLPPDFLRSLSDGQRQWWEFKSKHMDKVMFLKMGKFYELFEMDARIGAKELDLQYMKGGQPHCGFPEKNFSMNVGRVIEFLL